MKLKIVVFLILTSITLEAQSIVGLWEIKNVAVGEEEMTPVAKWIEIESDLSFSTGNGWTKNSEGVIEYDSLNQTIKPVTKNGINDPFGDFKLYFEGGSMIWERKEEGDLVRVYQERIEEIPASPADEIVGLWEIESDEDDSIHKVLFLRPDKLYRKMGKNLDTEDGFWHMNGHRPILTLINNDRAVENEIYNISFFEEKLILTDSKNKMNTLEFKRISEFPGQ